MYGDTTNKEIIKRMVDTEYDKQCQKLIFEGNTNPKTKTESCNQEEEITIDFNCFGKHPLEGYG